MTPRRDARRRQAPSRAIWHRISRFRPCERMWRTKLPRSAHALRPLRTLPAPLPGHESVRVPRRPWETSSARRFVFGPAGTLCYRHANGSKLQQPARTRTICEVATTEPIHSMADASKPRTQPQNPTLHDVSRQCPSQQSARRCEPVPRAQLGSRGSSSPSPCPTRLRVIS